MNARAVQPDPERSEASRRPGPRRRDGGPAGPREVRRAILDAASELFATRGLGEVALREVAQRANVQVSLISRYIGSREDLIEAVMTDLAERVGQDLADRPLEQQSFEPDSALGRWTRLLAAFAVSGRDYTPSAGLDPSAALTQVIRTAFGLDERAARVRAAQVVAVALGWRLFEAYLVDTGDLGEIPISALRDELTETVKRIAATPWTAPGQPRAEGTGLRRAPE